MTVTIPAELEIAIQQKARERRVPVANVVQDALHWYLQMDVDLLDELAAWQEVRDEAASALEENVP